MMFVVRTTAGGSIPESVPIKAVRETPTTVRDGAGKFDYFCVGTEETVAAFRQEGLEVIELRDGWYEIAAQGGVAIWGQGRYWEVRSDPFTVKEAAGAAGVDAEPSGEEVVDVRGEIFGV